MRSVTRVATPLFIAIIPLFNSETALSQDYEFKGGYSTHGTDRNAHDHHNR
jgi:hypothetical protein